MGFSETEVSSRV